jgi:hypothetical protein
MLEDWPELVGADGAGLADDTGETAEPPQLSRQDEVNTASNVRAESAVNRWNVRGISFTMTAKLEPGEITKERAISVHGLVVG